MGRVPPKNRGQQAAKTVDTAEKRATRSSPVKMGMVSPTKTPSPKRKTASAAPNPTKKVVIRKPGPLSKTKLLEKKVESQSTSDTDDLEEDMEEDPLFFVPDKSSGSSNSLKESSLTPVAQKKQHGIVKKATSRKSNSKVETSFSSDNEISVTGTEANKAAKNEKGKQEEEELYEEGRNVFARMSPQDIIDMLGRIDNLCNPNDHFTISKREHALDWEKVAVEPYSARQCNGLWLYLKKNTRNYRIMNEVVNEIKHKIIVDQPFQFKLVESLPGFPQKPIATNGFQVYNRQKWDELKEKSDSNSNMPNFVVFMRICRGSYATLPKAEQAKYDRKASEMVAEYRKKIQAFCSENPSICPYVSERILGDNERTTRKMIKQAKVNSHKKERKRKDSGNNLLDLTSTEEPVSYDDAPKIPPTPVAMFMKSKLSRLNPQPTKSELPAHKNEIFETWTNLTTRKRAKWIDTCIKACVHYLEASREYQKEHPEYKIPELKIHKLLSKEELALWELFKGKPETPKSTVYEVFADSVVTDPKYEDLPESERRNLAISKWKTMDEYNKDMLTMKYKISKVEYKKQLKNFYTQLPEFMKQDALKRIHKVYAKGLEEPDKVPEESESVMSPLGSPVVEEFISAEDGVVFSSSKKSKKRKRQKDVEEEATEDYGVLLPSAEFEEPQSEEEPIQHKKVKKHKKKKKHRDEDDAAEAEAEGTNEDTNQDFVPQKSWTSVDVHKIAKARTEKMAKSGEETVFDLADHFVDKQKTSSTFFPKNNSITKNDVFEVVRGIFDARKLGRKFSIYYYYAKHVALENYWIDSINDNGFESTAIKIIKTFLGLPNSQQAKFIETSYAFHSSRRLNHSALFPAEPEPPPKLAYLLYNKECGTRDGKKFTNIKWPDLPEHVQNYYVVKLYHLTKEYMRKYDAFIANLTPNDFVEYALFRYRIWEKSLYTKTAVQSATREFIFPLPAPEYEDKGEQHDDPLPISEAKIYNPFCNKTIEKVTKTLLMSSK